MFLSQTCIFRDEIFVIKHAFVVEYTCLVKKICFWSPNIFLLVTKFRICQKNYDRQEIVTKFLVFPLNNISLTWPKILMM